MPAYSQDQVPIEFEVGRRPGAVVEQGGMTLAFERLSAGVETAPLFKGLPDDACQSPHWGYVISGRLRIVATDGSEETLDGRSGLLPAGGPQRGRRGGRAPDRVLAHPRAGEDDGARRPDDQAAAGA